MFRDQGVYEAKAFGFDQRQYVESFISVTVFRIPCNVPEVYLPLNFTAYDRLDQIPTMKKSQEFQSEAKVNIQCNESIPTSFEWSAYKMELVPAPIGKVGLKESLTEYPIKDKVPSYNQLQLNIPARTLEKGLYKLVFKFEVCICQSKSKIRVNTIPSTSID